MESEFWHERWQTGSTRFDQTEVHLLLAEHWLSQVGAGAVFVPLCGRTIDMEWLAAQGHRVVGNELSPIAVADFFEHRDLMPDVRTEGTLVVHTATDYELWCGDLFDMPTAALDGVTAVYDRASLVAMPPEMRRRYVDHMIAIVPTDALIFLISFEYDQVEMDGPPFSVERDEVTDLYADAFTPEVVVAADVLERNPDLRARGLTRLTETLTVLRRCVRPLDPATHLT